MVAKPGGRSGFSIKITPRRPDKKFRRVIKQFRKELKRIGKKLEPSGLKIIKDATPVGRTGATQAAWRSTMKFTSDGGFRVTWTNPTAASHFQNVGTAPSPGGFIPAIDVRIFQGVHPGSTQNVRYLDRAGKDVENLTTEKLGKLSRFMQVSINRNLKGKGGR